MPADGTGLPGPEAFVGKTMKEVMPAEVRAQIEPFYIGALEGRPGSLEVSYAGRYHGVQVVPHSAYFGPGLLASTHVIASYAGEIPVERYYADFDATPLHEAINPKNGRMLVPQGPGLGCDPDLDVVERLRVDA